MSFAHLRCLLSCFAALVLLPTHGAAQDWQRFRGPNGTGLSDASTIPLQVDPANSKWSIKLPGAGYASPVVVGERMYCLCSDPESATREVLCLHVSDGHQLWKRRFDSKPHHLHPDNGYASSTPCADQDGVVMAWSTPEQLLLVALDVEGNELWRRDLGPYKALWGHATSPIIVDGMVVMLNDQMNPNVMQRFFPEGMEVGVPGKSCLIALDRMTGETKWEIPRQSVLAGYSTPCVRTNQQGNRELVFVGTSHGLTGVDPKSGTINWQVNELRSRTVICPIIANDLVLASHGLGLKGDHLVAVRPDAKTELGEVVYDVKESVPLVPCAIYLDGLIFLLSDDGVASCRQAKTGKLMWRKRLGGNYYASLICVAKRIYCISRSGKVTVVQAAKQFKKLAESELGEKCFATPAIAGGVMFLRTETKLFAISNK